MHNKFTSIILPIIVPEIKLVHSQLNTNDYAARNRVCSYYYNYLH